MLEWLNEVIMSARQHFSREKSFKWFVVIVIGMMIWQEQVGVTSLIRELGIDPKHYTSILHFFRSKAWTLTTLQGWWLQVVLVSGVIYQVNGMPVLIGDGTKKNKYGMKMPCVKRMTQESGNASKHYTFGHMFGAIGVLAGNIEKLFCIPLSVTIHDGDKKIRQWANSETQDESHVIRTIRDACQVALRFTHSILLLDRYYLTKPALRAWIDEEKRAGCSLLTIITRAKLNAIAYELPERNPKGRPKLYGNKLKIINLIETYKHKFTKAKVVMYGKIEEVSYFSIDLLWGYGLRQELRFVIVCQDGKQPVFLVCTNLTLPPLQIMRLYGYRFKVECCFRELKHTVSGFVYRFWTSAMPKLNRFAKSGFEPLDEISVDKDKELILSTYEAIHRFIFLACISLGLLQICALRFSNVINNSPVRWLRTRTNSIPSEASTADFMRKTIFRAFHFSADFCILRLIRQLQVVPSDSLESELS